MLKKILGSFLLAFQNIRSNFLHTVLSVLGIVIGVAALVAILSLIDGAEKFAKEQISTTTSLNIIAINSNPYTEMNGVRIKKDSVSVISYDVYLGLSNALTKPAINYFRSSVSDQVRLKETGESIGVVLFASNEFIAPDVVAQSGLFIYQRKYSKQRFNCYSKRSIC